MGGYTLPFYQSEMPGYISDPYYLDRLPEYITQIINEIEEVIHFRIEVQFDSAYKNARCEKQRNRAVIYFPSYQYFNHGSLLHELLHLKIFYVNKIDLAIGANRYLGEAWDKVVEQCDNWIEHFIFVSTEINHCPSRKSYWCKVLHEKLHELEDMELLTDEVKGDILLYWGFSSVVLGFPKKLMRRIEALAAKCEIKDDCKQFQGNILIAGKDKTKLIEVFNKLLPIPDDLLELSEF